MSSLFPQTVIAMIWDFDKTLSPSYMQKPLFNRFGVDPDLFWAEVGTTVRVYEGSGISVSTEAVILNQILRYVEDKKFQDLDNNLLKSLGSQIDFYEGLPDFFGKSKDFVKSKTDYETFNISLEHYVVSTGLRQMILGSKVAQYIEDVWGCEFMEEKTASGVSICEIAYLLDHTTKTRALFEINKGSNKHHEIDVNATIDPAYRRVSFENMIYVADGPSDIPAFSIINHFHGRTYAVYPAGSMRDLKQCKNLLDDRRVKAFGEANYKEGSQTYMWFLASIEEIADSIVQKKKATLASKISAPPQHLT